MHALASLPNIPIAESSSSWLITPNVGLMVWILVVFAISLYILKKVVFPRITAALDERRATIDESIDSAERTRVEADKILAEYRERLKEARVQSEEILGRARQAAERAERDIDAASKRALDDIRREVADLTIMATEKVTRKTLDDDDQRRLVEEALSELDFSSLASGAQSN